MRFLFTPHNTNNDEDCSLNKKTKVPADGQQRSFVVELAHSVFKVKYRHDGRDDRGLGVFGVKTLRRTIEVLIFILPTLSLSIFPNGDK